MYGKESMRRMATANILISGANGLGIEIGEPLEPSRATALCPHTPPVPGRAGRSLAAAPHTSARTRPAAKNVILAGLKSITLHDRAEASLSDLGSQFYLTPADVGRNRAEACRSASALAAAAARSHAPYFDWTGAARLLRRVSLRIRTGAGGAGGRAQP